ncbi:conserved Plasmodium protein, unknown function [Plasmodium sp. DRC-Itaito]|nr:conserved Plasmodium protein, unknown function [Plasmodium sp. DRC-Itaito]
MFSIQHNLLFDKLRYINKLTVCYCFNIIYKKNYNTGGEYSSNISRIFYHINEKLKNVTKKNLRKNEYRNKKEKEENTKNINNIKSINNINNINNNTNVNIINKPTHHGNNKIFNLIKDDEDISHPNDSLEIDIMYECSKEKELKYIYNQYDKIICKINYNKMMGRDLSYCMNIISKIKYFKDNIFWYKSSDKLIKGYMIHKINIQSFYIIANALSKINLLYNKKENIQYEYNQQIYNKDLKNETICNNIIIKNKLPYNKLLCQNIKTDFISPFTYISFDDQIILHHDKYNSCKYHNIYDQIAYRFIMDIQNMNLDSISCTLNLFSKLNMLKYNFIGYYFADYFVLYILNKNIKIKKNNIKKNNIKKNNIKKNNINNNNINNIYNIYNSNDNIRGETKNLSQNISYTTMFSYLNNKNKYTDITPNKYNISKLVIILHSLIKFNVIHLEFFYICLEYFNTYFIHLNNIDMCNILYCFSRSQLAIRSNNTIHKLCMRKRITDKSFQNFVNNIIKKLEIYNQVYSMDQINNMENMYNGYYDYFDRLKNNLSSSNDNLSSSYNYLSSSKDDLPSSYDYLSSSYNYLPSLSSLTDSFFFINTNGKVDKMKCWNLLNKIINNIEKNENILNNFTSLQISSIILSVCKLKINSLNIFYALNYRVHYLWRYFSLHSIADYLYAINEKNIYDEQIFILLFCQFVKIIWYKYLQYIQNKLFLGPINNDKYKNKIKQNNQGIIYHVLTNVDNNHHHNGHHNDQHNNIIKRKKEKKKKLHLLNQSDISMCVRIFQSFSKSDIIKNINMFLYYYHIFFPYDISTICIYYDKNINEKDISMGHNFNMDILFKNNISDHETEIKNTNQDVHIYCDNNHNYNNFKTDHLFNSYNKEGKNVQTNFFSYEQDEQEDDKNFWINLNLYPTKSFLFLHTYKKYIDIIKLYTLRTFFFLIFQHYHIMTLDQKCLLSYFMLNIPQFIYPFRLSNKNNILVNNNDIKYIKQATNNNNIDTYMDKIFPFKLYFKKEMKHLNIYIPPAANILFDILFNMELNTLNEITIRQIYTCLLCLHLNIIKFSYYTPPCKNKNDIKNENNNNNNNNSLLHKKFIFHLLSLNMLKKINSFLDNVNQNKTQQNEINLSSRTHNEVYNYLKSLIGSGMFYKKGKKINQMSEFVVGPFVLDCVIQFL